MPGDAVIDLKYLRTLTDGDVELEKQLFQLFLTTSENCLIKLASEDAAWGRLLHELRGAALGLGVNRIALLCKEAEALDQGQSEKRKESLKAIEKEIAAVRAFCAQQYA